ncbi:hypothetical protein [Hydrogenophaga sp. R2]|uniref:hypothetical protein n=1 Tax=Hydrogenophaga sp. R2 TaxID=3132827 RepID=UPI003CE984E0
MNQNLFATFSQTIRNLNAVELEGAPSLYEKLTIAKDGALSICYAPFEYINRQARIVIVGITPGQTQMLNAVREARRQILAGAPDEVVLKAAKATAAFSGAMRPNLTSLMDCVGLQHWLRIPSCEELFAGASHLVQTTSALRNPVFVDGANYNGTPNMTRHPLLREHLLSGLGQDAAALPSAVFIPLGDKVAEALRFLADRGVMRHEQIFDGLPHPSGANGERIAYFVGNKRREDLSPKTDGVKLDLARRDLQRRVACLP